MRYVISALLSILLFSFTQIASAQVFGPIVIDAAKQQMLDSVEMLDTLDLPTEKVEIYPDIMDIFKRARGFSEDNNPYDKFLFSHSVERGRSYLDQNRQVLQEVAGEYSIPPEIFVSILRIESNFGRHTYSHQALGAYASIIFLADREVRKGWARTQLEALLEMADRNNQDPTEIRSSYAGAIGYPQFLPTSYLAYGVDGDGDGVVDLYNLRDALWSIGNYLVEHGWHTDKERAVWLYNRSSLYVEGIFAYAAALR